MRTLQRFTIIARLQEDVELYHLKVPMAISCRGNMYHTYYTYYTHIVRINQDEVRLREFSRMI
jgi:hypothetical protein